MSQYMRILAVESSGLVGSCGVYERRGGETISLGEVVFHGYLHTRTLAPSVDTLLRGLRLSFKDLDAVAVSRGPGFFTSTRIGLSFAQALAWSLNLPLLAVDTLRSLVALELTEMEGKVLALYDARKRQLYSSAFVVEDESLKPIWELRLVNFSDLRDLKETLGDFNLLIYPGNLREEELIKIYNDLSPLSVIELEPSAKGVVEAVFTYDELPLFSPISVKGIYLRPSDAELAKGKEVT